MKDGIISSFNSTRCHALIVKVLIGGERYIGKFDGFEIWKIENHDWLNRFGFVVVKKDDHEQA